MSGATAAKEPGVPRYDCPEEISWKLKFLATSLNNLQYWKSDPTGEECAGLMLILDEIADVVRTFGMMPDE